MPEGHKELGEEEYLLAYAYVDTRIDARGLGNDELDIFKRGEEPFRLILELKPVIRTAVPWRPR